MLEREEIRRAVQMALAEDIGSGDATTLATVPPDTKVSASVLAREPLVVAGLQLAEAAFAELCPDTTIRRVVRDGDRVQKGGALLVLTEAYGRGVLSAERVALNFLQRLSGIATLTAQYVEAVAMTKARILDTRKTTPGWRRLEKYAVTCGGGANYRFGLFDQILIKDNHLAALAAAPLSGSLPAGREKNEEKSASADTKVNVIEAAVLAARAHYPQLKVEVEADTLEQVKQAADAGADIILFDNMTLEQLRAAVALVNGRAKTEASGGVNLSTVRAIAETGVDFISVGALTHSARAVDIALDFGVSPSKQ
jgi:nicotinate-nucleotide pyrophosphorylase (carboxylating)